MSARSKARKQSLDLLYEADIRGKASTDVLALRDVGIQIPAAVEMMLMSGRSVAGYKNQVQRVH